MEDDALEIRAQARAIGRDQVLHVLVLALGGAHLDQLSGRGGQTIATPTKGRPAEIAPPRASLDDRDPASALGPFEHRAEERRMAVPADHEVDAGDLTDELAVVINAEMGERDDDVGLAAQEG